MVACGEDEFGNLFADVNVEDVQTLRGFGSLQWSLEDESDPSAITPSREMPPKGLPAASLHGCHANVNPAQAELESSLKCKSVFRAEHEHKHKNDATGAAGIAFRENDLATDSDDDLRIVLDPLRKAVAEDSEDGEDFVVLTGSGHEWCEKSLVSTEESTQAKGVGGEKVGLSAEEQVQNHKTFGVHPGICYGGHAYRRHYRVMSELKSMRTEFSC
ncbi:hypothetical protein L7F22_004144 [Adiantum nelumboides]|nr:hypothetical protein [Adiantum nelumboides]